MSNGIKRYISVMQLTLINKKYMHYAPHIAMLVTLLLIGQQLAKLSWRMILPASSPGIEMNDAPEIAALIPAPKAELPVFTLFGRAEKNRRHQHMTAASNRPRSLPLSCGLPACSPAATRPAPLSSWQKEINRLA
jgi:hypothetical protein